MKTRVRQKHDNSKQYGIPKHLLFAVFGCIIAAILGIYFQDIFPIVIYVFALIALAIYTANSKRSIEVQHDDVSKNIPIKNVDLENIIQSHQYFRHHRTSIQLMKNRIIQDRYKREYMMKHFGLIAACFVSLISMTLGFGTLFNVKEIPFVSLIILIIPIILWLICSKHMTKELQNSVHSKTNRFLFLKTSKKPLKYKEKQNDIGGIDYIFTEI